MLKLTIGADPEFFLKKGDEFVSAHNLVPGSKADPFPLEKGAVQVDGTAVEFNINPASTSEEFVGNIKSVLHDIRNMIPMELEFAFVPKVLYEGGYFKKIPQYAKELGCSPDFDAFTGAMNPTPKPPKGLKTMRTGAGHIHIGWGEGLDVEDTDHLFDCREIVKAVDITVGGFSRRWDADQERMRMYGKRGAFRPKPYGVEYRTFSNAWLNYPDMWPWLFNSTTEVVQHLVETGSSVVYIGPPTGIK